jgi:ABC-2 type transport system permease protein
VPVGLLPAAGGFVLNVVVDSVDAPAWVGALSPFAHLAAVPVEAPDVPGAVGMLALGALLGAAGTLGYARRDVRGG